MNTRNIFLPLFFLLWRSSCIAEEINVGVLLPSHSQTLEKELPAVIEELNRACQSKFKLVSPLTYGDCPQAAKKTDEAAKHQVKVLFSEGCFSDIGHNVLKHAISLYPISSYTESSEIKKELEKYCGERTNPSPPKIHVVSVPFAPLRAIPLENTSEVVKLTPQDLVLTQGDGVVENPKDTKLNQYTEDFCKKSVNGQRVRYGWSLTYEWACVTVKQAKDSSLQNKKGWIHRWLLKEEQEKE